MIQIGAGKSFPRIAFACEDVNGLPKIFRGAHQAWVTL